MVGGVLDVIKFFNLDIVNQAHLTATHHLQVFISLNLIDYT